MSRTRAFVIAVAVFQAVAIIAISVVYMRQIDAMYAEFAADPLNWNTRAKGGER